VVVINRLKCLDILNATSLHSNPDHPNYKHLSNDCSRSTNSPSSFLSMTHAPKNKEHHLPERWFHYELLYKKLVLEHHNPSPPPQPTDISSLFLHPAATRQSLPHSTKPIDEDSPSIQLLYHKSTPHLPPQDPNPLRKPISSPPSATTPRLTNRNFTPLHFRRNR